jgi:hypothetical protein
MYLLKPNDKDAETIVMVGFVLAGMLTLSGISTVPVDNIPQHVASLPHRWATKLRGMAAFLSSQRLQLMLWYFCVWLFALIVSWFGREVDWWYADDDELFLYSIVITCLVALLHVIVAFAPWRKS